MSPGGRPGARNDAAAEPAPRHSAPGRERRRAARSSSSCRRQAVFAQPFLTPCTPARPMPATRCGAGSRSLYIPLHDHLHDHTGTPMLQAIRTRAGSIIVKVLFALLIVSFGFWGIYTRSDYLQGHSPETVIATVGDRNIRAEELQQALQPAMERLRNQFGGTIDQQQMKQLGVVDTLLDQLINRALLDQETARLGLEASDDIVRSAIYDNPAFKGPDGRFDRGLFNQVLTVNHFTEEQLVERIRREVPRSQLLQAITAGVTVPQPVVETVYRHRAEKR